MVLMRVYIHIYFCNRPFKCSEITWRNRVNFNLITRYGRLQLNHSVCLQLKCKWRASNMRAIKMNLMAHLWNSMQYTCYFVVIFIYRLQIEWLLAILDDFSLFIKGNCILKSHITITTGSFSSSLLYSSASFFASLCYRWYRCREF